MYSFTRRGPIPGAAAEKGDSMARSTRRTRAVIGAVVAAALVATTLAATVSGAGAAKQVRGFDGTTIKLAGIGIAAQFAEAGIAAEARVNKFNDTNEIKGIKLEWVEFADDKQDPATALSETRRLVTQEQVFALTADTSQFNAGDYLNQQHVPYFGWGFDATYCSHNPSSTLYGFSFTGCLLNSDPSVIANANQNQYDLVSKATGKKSPTVFLVGNDSTSSKISIKNQTLSNTKVGFKVVGTDNTMPLPPVPDYTPYAQKALTADNGNPPDVISCLLSTDCINLWGLLKAQGYKGYFISNVFSNAITKIMAGSYANIFFVPPDQKTSAQADMAKYINAVKAGTGDNLSSAQVAGWGSTDQFIAALKTVAKKGKNNITPENVQKAAAKQTWKIDGLTGPVSYPDSTVVPKPYCTALVQAAADGSSWTQAFPYTCNSKQYPAPKS
jgi:branched-chain amino acid transport system substrate-binding protein